MTNSQLRLCVFISWYLIYIHARPSIVQSDLHDLGKKNVEDDEVEHLKSSNKRLLIRTSNKNPKGKTNNASSLVSMINLNIAIKIIMAY